MTEKHFSVESVARLRSEKRITLLNPNMVVLKCLEIADNKIGRLLDVGTGTGLFAEHFQKLGFEVTGIDDSDIMLKEAQRIIPTSKFIQASADELPFKDKTFDFIFLGHLLHEVENPEVVLKEAKRVTRNNIFVLEWPYKTEEMGPPLEHRMSQDSIEKLFLKASIGQCHSLRVHNMMLYFSR